MTQYGVRRLVVINSGNYSIANVDLSRPVHFAAPNNRGKSTLVNALQFLYVDDFHRMKFGRRNHDDTKKHYFGADRSYLVFECLTTSGIQCMLIRGLGTLRGGTFERYIYDGEFWETDYVEDEEIRDFDDVRKRLADRHLARVKKSELWQVLAGNLPSGDGKAIPRLTVLPIRRRDEYLAFRDVFVRLLSLSNADARTLRQLIIDSHARDVGERKIDVASEYKDEFDRAERSEQEFNFISSVAAEIDRGRQLRLSIQTLTEKFAATAPVAWRDACRCHSFIETETNQLAAELAGLTSDRTATQEEKESFLSTRGRLELSKETLEREWNRLKDAHKNWSSYSKAFVKTMRENVDRKGTEIAELQRHLDQVRSLDAKTLRRQMEQLKREIATDRQALDQVDQTAAAELRKAGLSEAEIDDAFRVLNPDLLKLVVGNTLAVNDPEHVLGRVRTIARRIQDGSYVDDAVQANLAGIAGPNSAILANPSELREHITLREHDLAQQEARLRTAEDQETAKTNLNAMKQEHSRLRANLDEYDRYVAAWKDRAALKTQLTDTAQELAAAQGQIRKCEEHLKMLIADEKRIQGELNALSETKTSLNAAANELRSEAERVALYDHLPAAGDNDNDDLVQPKSVRRFAASVRRRLSLLASELRQLSSSRADVKQIQDVITVRSREFEMQERYFSDEDEEWHLLSESRDSLPQLEEAAKRNWDALSTTLGARLNAIVAGVRSIKLAVERINRGLKAYQVSNLREVQIKVEEEHDTYSAVEALSSQGSLFQDRDAVDIAKRRLRLMIERNETIELESLFELRIHIQEADGTSHQAASLDEIGSTGTGMTAKAMIFVQLVRAIAGNEKYRLHFYIDGLGELDDRNLEATAGMAVSKGIMPITADPRLHLEPLAHPEVTVYSLGQSSDGRFHIDASKTYHARRMVQTETTRE